MIAQTLNTSCGLDGGWWCEVLSGDSDARASAQLTHLAVVLLLIAGAAWLIARLLRRHLPKATRAYISSREADVARLSELAAAEGIDVTDRQRIDRSLQLDRARQRAETLGAVAGSLLTGVVWFIAFLLALDQLGLNLAPLLAGAGVVGIALGFGAQEMVRDFLSGIFILIEDQYGVGDVVDLGEASGSVEQVNLRVTRLRDVDGVVWYVPNGEIQRVGNKSQLWSRAVLDIDVGYETDVDAAGQILKDVAVGLWQEELEDLTILDEPEYWGVERFGADGVTLRLVVRTEPTEQWAIARELRRRIKVAFEQSAIEIPFPQRTVRIRTEEPAPAADS